MEKNYYEILEVDVKASKEIIEKAFKVLAKRYHPDTQSEDKKDWAEEKFKELNEAYEVLSNDESRKNYDIELDYDKNSVIDALCAKNENLQHLVEELQKELEYVKTHNDETINNSNKFNTVEVQTPDNSYDTENIQNTAPNYTEYYRVVPQYEPSYYEEKNFYKKSKLKDILAFIITIICILGIGFILWKIPVTNEFLINLYEDNPPLKAIVDFIIGIFNR